MPTPLSVTPISTSPGAAAHGDLDLGPAPACLIALSSTLPTTTRRSESAIGIVSPGEATHATAACPRSRRARARSSTTVAATSPASVSASAMRALAAVEGREQQHLVDELAHVHDLVLDGVGQLLALLLVERQAERLDQAADALQRRAQLVRDGRREDAPGLAVVDLLGDVREHGDGGPAGAGGVGAQRGEPDAAVGPAQLDVGDRRAAEHRRARVVSSSDEAPRPCGRRRRGRTRRRRRRWPGPPGRQGRSPGPATGTPPSPTRARSGRSRAGRGAPWCAAGASGRRRSAGRPAPTASRAARGAPATAEAPRRAPRRARARAPRRRSPHPKGTPARGMDTGGLL